MTVYASDDDGTLYGAEEVDVNPSTGLADGYTRYEIQDEFVLTASQCIGHYGSLVEILSAAGKLTKA